MQQQLMQLFQQMNSQSTPFWTNQIQNGLPFFNQLVDYSGGTLAKSFQPAQAQLNRRLAGFGDTLPSGMGEQLQTNLGAEEGEAFDQNMVSNLMMNQQAKERAAMALSPMAPAAAATGAGGSVLGAPPVNAGGIGNFLGGAVSGLFNNAGLAATAAGV